MTAIQTSGSFDGDYYSLIIAFNDQHAITIDALSKEDMLELQSCINCMLIED
jgi:hypothetical protein